MPSMDLLKLHKIDEELTKDEVAALKFLCMDIVTKKRLENVKDAKDLFLQLDEQAMFEDELLLPELLYTIGRYDLLPILNTNKTAVSRLLRNQDNARSGVLEYRKMLYELSEDITDSYLQTIKFLLTGLPKAKLNSATFLDILAEMEKVERLGEDNLDELESVLDKCSKDLAFKVQTFKNKYERTSRREDHSIPVNPTITSFSSNEETESGSFNLSIAESCTSSVLEREFAVATDSKPGSATEVSSATKPNKNDFYDMTHRPRGYCLIINNYNFKMSRVFPDRKGTDVDKDSLTRVFKRMHFVVKVKRDLSSSDMMEVVKKYSEKNHFQMDAFVCCILSHGEKGSVLGVDGKPVLIRDLTQPFSQCSTLRGKPKLFFIQACQGTELQQGIWMEDGVKKQEDEYEEDGHQSGLSIPITADFLIGMATVEYYKSFRHTVNGSIFIQELCGQLEAGCPKNEDILSILTKVNANVSRKVLLGHKQMPEPRYTLTKKLVLPMD